MGFEHARLFGTQMLPSGWYEKVEKYVKFLHRVQEPSGAVPHWIIAANSTHPMSAHARLRESAASAISGVVLARFARFASQQGTGRNAGSVRARKAAKSIGVFVRRSVLPEQKILGFRNIF